MNPLLRIFALLVLSFFSHSNKLFTLIILFLFDFCSLQVNGTYDSNKSFH